MKFKWSKSINVAAAVVVAVCTVFALKLAYSQLDVPEPPQWVCSSTALAPVGSDIFPAGDPDSYTRPIIRWQMKPDDPWIKGYRIFRAERDSPDQLMSPYSYLENVLVFPDMPEYTDYSCRGECAYRIAVESLSGRQSQASQAIHCRDGSDGFRCNKPCVDMSEEKKEQLDSSLWPSQ